VCFALPPLRLDHAGFLKEYIKIFKCYSLPETFEKLKISHHNAISIEPEKLIKVGSFKIYPLPVVHDVPTLAFLIDAEGLGLTIFATDCESLPYTIDGLKNIIIEANYDEEILDNNYFRGSSKGFLRDRIKHSHMSIEQTKEFLLRNNIANVENIILIHLSNSNSNEKDFKADLEKKIGKKIVIADNGLTIDLKGF